MAPKANSRAPETSSAVKPLAVRMLSKARSSALDAGGCEMTTVVVRRVDMSTRERGSLLDAVPPDRFHIIPNTAGCTTVKEAVTPHVSAA